MWIAIPDEQKLAAPSPPARQPSGDWEPSKSEAERREVLLVATPSKARPLKAYTTCAAGSGPGRNLFRAAIAGLARRQKRNSIGRLKNKIETTEFSDSSSYICNTYLLLFISTFQPCKTSTQQGLYSSGGVEYSSSRAHWAKDNAFAQNIDNLDSNFPF